MPQRPPTPQEAAWYQSQGIDPSQVMLNMPDEPISQAATIGRTLKAHAGGIAGGGLGTIGGLAAASWLLGPEVGVPASIASGLIGATGGGLVGGYGGQKAQEALQGPEETALLQQQAAEAAAQHPYTAAATDIGASALASGGRPSADAIRGISGLIGGAVRPAENPALWNTAFQAAINPAIASGISLASGQGMPSSKELGEQALGGALFSKSWLPHGRPGISKEEPTEVTNKEGENVPTKEEEEKLVQMSPWTELDDEGNYKIGDNQVKQEWLKQNLKPIKDIKDNILKAQARTANDKIRSNANDYDAMRNELHLKHLASEEPIGDIRDETPEQYEVTDSDESTPRTPTASSAAPPAADLGSRVGPLAVTPSGEGDALNEGKALGGLKPASSSEGTSSANLHGSEVHIADPNGLVHQILLEGEAEDGTRTGIEKSTGKPVTISPKGEVTYASEKQGAVGVPSNTPPGNTETVAEGVSSGAQKPTAVPPNTEGRLSVEEENELKKKMVLNAPKGGDNGIGLPLLLRRAILQGKATTGSILTHLSNTTSHLYQPLSTSLLAASDEQSLKVPWFHDPKLGTPGNLRSHYDPNTDQVNIGTSSIGDARVVMEEAVHSMTSKKLPRFAGTGYQYRKFLEHYIANGQNPHVKEIMRAYLKTADTLGHSDKLFAPGTGVANKEGADAAQNLFYGKVPGNTGYALGNLDEYIAQAIKDPDFQHVLEGIKADDNRTVWQQIVDAIKNLLGIKGKTGSMLESVLRSSGELIRQERPGMSDGSGKVQTLARDRSGNFILNAKYLIEHPEEFGIRPNSTGTYNGTQLINTIRNKSTPTEWNILKERGIEQALGGRNVSQEEAGKWIEEHSPKVEVRKFGEGSHNVKRDADNQLMHDLETAGYTTDVNTITNRLVVRRIGQSGNIDPQTLPENLRQRTIDWIQRGQESYGHEENAAHHSIVAPKSEKDMPGYTEIAVVSKPKENIGDIDTPMGRNAIKFPSSHDFPPNTLGFARGYMETDPKTGDKTFHVIETQSDLVVNNHDGTFQVLGHPEFGTKISRNEAAEHVAKLEPLHPSYERLALKAAIEHARQEGATKIAVSDAETAMMTEGHDRVNQGSGVNAPEINQEPGMRLHYDRTLPKILEELTGKKGERVEFGEHEKAVQPRTLMSDSVPEESLKEELDAYKHMHPDRTFTTEPYKYASGKTVHRIYQEVTPRSDLIFRNADNTPKTSVSARSYDITGLPDRNPKLYGKLFTPPEQHGTPEEIAALKTPHDLGLPPDKYMGKVGLLTRSVLDKVRDINTPQAHLIADNAQKELNKETELKGQWKNPIVRTGLKLSAFDKERTKMAFEADLSDRTHNHTEVLTNPAQRQFYNLVRTLLKTSAKQQIAIGEPITQAISKGGKTIYIKRDLRSYDNYVPGMTNQVVTQVYKANTDRAAIAKMDKIFDEYNQKVQGLSASESKRRIDNFKKALQGSPEKANLSNQGWLNARRKAMGTPLPPEFREQDIVRNFERYFDRAAIDAAHYEFMEKDHNVLAALGQTHDAWGNTVKPLEDGGLANNSAVQELLHQWNEGVRNPADYNESSFSSLITAAFISGPPIETHKIISNVVATMTQTANPVVLSRAIIHAVGNINSAYTRAEANGVVRLTSRNLSQMITGTTTATEKMQILARTIRKISTLNDLTTKLGVGLVQGMNEVIIPSKILRAQAGDVTSIKFLRNLDPSFNPRVPLNDAGVQRLASIATNYAHGTGDIRSLPGWMLNDSEFSGFFSLAHWSIAQTNNFMKNVYEPALRGNIEPLIVGAVGAAMGGYVIKELREKIQGKKSPIPSLQDIEASSKGIEGNVPLVAYNVISAFQYSGFGGLLSQVSKYPFDAIYKNQSQGATFPLDEVAEDAATTAHQIATAIANDPNLNWMDVAQTATLHVLSSNLQLARIAVNQGINSGIITGLPAEKKELADKMNRLRRFDMVEALPYNDIDEASNPYMNLEQKRFKLEQDPQKAIAQLPGLVHNIFENYSDKPDVMMNKLKALKENAYSTFPSLQQMPLSFFKYVTYLSKEEGPEAAQKEFMDYLMHKTVNEAKASAVP